MSDPRLSTERTLWLATVRRDGRPHLAPVWFVWVRQRIYVCTEGRSVKVRNIAANPRACAALGDGNQPVIAEGRAAILGRPYPDDIVAEFKRKYDWDIVIDDSYDALIEITPEKWLSW